MQEAAIYSASAEQDTPTYLHQTNIGRNSEERSYFQSLLNIFWFLYDKIRGSYFDGKRHNHLMIYH